MTVHFENGENVVVAKFELVFTQYWHNLKTIESTTITYSVQSLQEFDVKEMYVNVKNRIASL